MTLRSELAGGAGGAGGLEPTTGGYEKPGLVHRPR
jgi:hypothetical protein